MTHLNTLIQHPTLANLVELYEPIREPLRYVERALRSPHSLIEGGRRELRHEGLSPDFDLRETASAYFLEGEFPGIGGREDIKLHWLDGHTLRISGKIRRLDLEKEWAGEFTEAQDAIDELRRWKDIDLDNGTGEVVHDDGVELHTSGHKAHSGHPSEHTGAVRTWLSERRAGLYERNFTFPAVVNTDDVQARLSQGLLRVMVPKKHKEISEVKEVYVDVSDR